MTEHYSHVNVEEKRAAVEGMLSLVRGRVEPPPTGENHAAAGITGTVEAATGKLAGTSSEKAGTSGSGREDGARNRKNFVVLRGGRCRD